MLNAQTGALLHTWTLRAASANDYAWVLAVAFSPDGKLLVVANQDNGTVVPFAFDVTNGELKPVSAPVNVSKAICVLFEPAK